MIIKEFMDMHNHTIYSDGLLFPEQLEEYAVSSGIKYMGISDHVMLNIERELDTQKINYYFQEISRVKAKYEGKLIIYTGLEINVCDMKLIKKDIKLLSLFDYILIEGVYDQEMRYIEEIFMTLSQAGCIIGLAYTDLLEICSRLGAASFMSILRKYNIFWELNTKDGYTYFDNLIKDIYSDKIRSFLDYLRNNFIAVTAGSDLHSLNDFKIRRLKLANAIAININKHY